MGVDIVRRIVKYCSLSYLFVLRLRQVELGKFSRHSSLCMGRCFKVLSRLLPGTFKAPYTCVDRCFQVLSRLLSGMKDRVNNRVLKDYAKFMAERKAGRL